MTRKEKECDRLKGHSDTSTFGEKPAKEKSRKRKRESQMESLEILEPDTTASTKSKKSRKHSQDELFMKETVPLTVDNVDSEVFYLGKKREKQTKRSSEDGSVAVTVDETRSKVSSPSKKSKKDKKNSTVDNVESEMFSSEKESKKKLKKESSIIETGDDVESEVLSSTKKSKKEKRKNSAVDNVVSEVLSSMKESKKERRKKTKKELPDTETLPQAGADPGVLDKQTHSEEQTTRKKKKKKDKESQPALSSETNEKNKSNRALEYLRLWSSKRKKWKFNKMMQVQLLHMMYDKTLMGDEDFEPMLLYLDGLKGKGREKTKEDAKKILDGGSEGKVETDKEDRAKQVYQMLG